MFSSRPPKTLTWGNPIPIGFGFGSRSAGPTTPYRSRSTPPSRIASSDLVPSKGRVQAPGPSPSLAWHYNAGVTPAFSVGLSAWIHRSGIVSLSCVVQGDGSARFRRLQRDGSPAHAGPRSVPIRAMSPRRGPHHATAMGPGRKPAPSDRHLRAFGADRHFAGALDLAQTWSGSESGISAVLPAPATLTSERIGSCIGFDRGAQWAAERG